MQADGQLDLPFCDKDNKYCVVRCNDGVWTQLRVSCHARCPAFVPPQRERMVCEPAMFCKKEQNLTDDEKVNRYYAMSTRETGDRIYRHGSALRLRCKEEYEPHPFPQEEEIKCRDGRWSIPTLQCFTPCREEFNLQKARINEDTRRYEAQEASDNPITETQELAELRAIDKGPPRELKDVKSSLFADEYEPPKGSKAVPLYLHGFRYVIRCNTDMDVTSIVKQPFDFATCWDGQPSPDLCMRLSLISESCGDPVKMLIPTLEKPHAYVIEASGTTHGSVAHVTCAEGFSPGAGYEPERIECNDGPWWPPALRCDPHCPPYYEFLKENDPLALDDSRYVVEGYHGVDIVGSAFNITCHIFTSPGQLDPLPSGVPGPKARQEIRCAGGRWTARELNCYRSCPEYAPENEVETDVMFGPAHIVLDAGVGRVHIPSMADSLFASVQHGAKRTLKCCVAGEKVLQGDDPNRPTTECTWNWATIDNEGPKEAVSQCSDGTWTKPDIECRPMCTPLGDEYQFFEGSEAYNTSKGATAGKVESGLIYPGYSAHVRCKEGYLPEPQQGKWNSRPAAKVTCSGGFFTNMPFVCYKECPFPTSIEGDSHTRFNLDAVARQNEDATSAADLRSLWHKNPWLRRHGSVFYAFCWSGSRAEPLKAQLTGKQDMGNRYVRDKYKWFWSRGHHTDPVAERTYAGDTAFDHKRFQCLYGKWVPRTPPYMKCVESYYQWRRPEPRKPPPPPPPPPKKPPSRPPPPKACVASFMPVVRLSEDGGRAETVPVSMLQVGDRVMTAGGTGRRRPAFTEVYYRRSYAEELTRATALMFEPGHRRLVLSPSHRLPVCRPPPNRGVCPSQRHHQIIGDTANGSHVAMPSADNDDDYDGGCGDETRWRSIAAREVRAGDYVLLVGGGGGYQSGDDGLLIRAQVAEAHTEWQDVGYELVYTLSGLFVAGGAVITDSDDPFDEYMPWTLITNIDARVIYLLWGRQGVESPLFRSFYE
ncbi:unnamed protein product [Vitrella brassicaformis CCMP3155]|uniref:Sushi domain-containing protein n=2 Tax=Vitrella brassicaformis TaxID=1169539 RepID=A0A0G4F1R9_VITBC|nr:unnamed protein product [Vitrella brassicaformis CCMP3155]|eukprot:CEM05444.1 unnamed protein product [Vitrella brassicaformis CCMP3155]